MRWLLFLLLVGCSSPVATDPLQAALAAKGDDYAPRTHHVDAAGAPRFTNRLILESSPYLLQHAHNPVQWMAWGEEAFEKAQVEDKPILLSIGYSTCHWCHVMERESFEDLDIAAFINQHFVAIKVDREERPDVDAVYMAATRALSGRGGWPMTVVMTPERQPFFAGTYFPARTGDRGKREGFESILSRLQSEWATDRAGLVAKAAQLSGQVAGRATLRPGAEPAVDRFLAGARSIAAGFDPQYGGFGESKKFPRPSNLSLLLRYHRRTGDPHALHIVTHTLRAMANGGIHDQIGGGFHRYTVERRWLVPHFEKMLYDNAQLASLYIDVFQVTADPRFAEVAGRTLDYLAREMSHPQGGFYSATDADSLGPDGHREEGLFFTWTPDELRQVLGSEDMPIAIAAWGVSARGNFEGRNILHRPRALAQIARDLGRSEADIARDLARAGERMLEARASRAPPQRDDKILCAWNGLAISAFARGGRALARPDWIERAARAADFALETLRARGRLHRSWTGGQLGPTAYAEDHAFLIAGLLDLFEADGDRRWLRAAMGLDRDMQERFEASDGGWYRTAHDAEVLLLRERPHADGAEPSANGVHVMNLLRLGAWTTEPAYRVRAEAGVKAFGGELAARPSASPSLLAALDWLSDDPMEVAVIGGGDLPAALASVWTPNAVAWTHARPPDNVPWLAGKRMQAGEPTAYVCHEGLCKMPTSRADTFVAQLSEVVRIDAPALKPIASEPAAAPWQYDAATDKHWHPGHRHWHDGSAPKQ